MGSARSRTIMPVTLRMCKEQVLLRSRVVRQCDSVELRATLRFISFSAGHF